MSNTNSPIYLKKQIDQWMIFFMLVLLFSGITAIPLEKELSFLLTNVPLPGFVKEWLETCHLALSKTGETYPFLFYGYDWLAFAHIVIAILFIGPLRDPVKNIWVIEFGMIACVLIIPFALIAGHFRGIPFWWRLIDCSFGILGLIPLRICYKKIRKLELIIRQDEKEKSYSETLFQNA